MNRIIFETIRKCLNILRIENNRQGLPNMPTIESIQYRRECSHSKHILKYKGWPPSVVTKYGAIFEQNVQIILDKIRGSSQFRGSTASNKDYIKIFS